MFKTFIRVFLLLSMSLVGLLCFGQVRDRAYQTMLSNLLDHSVPEMGVDQAVKATSSAYFLDARERKEYDVSHIKGARYVGYDYFDLNTVKDIPKDKQIVVYCSVGYRSEKVSEKLIAAGYQNVSNLYGGIFEWVNAGQPVYSNVNQKTSKVHAYDKVWGVWLREGEKVY